MTDKAKQMKKGGNLYNSIDARQTWLERPRLRRLLEEAMNYPLVTVYAGAGYGKTRAVYSFLKDYNVHTIWMQITERDNVPLRFWENYTRAVAHIRPESVEFISEIGFPETDEAFTKFAAYIREANKLPGKYCVVIDDFYLIRNPVVLRTVERTIDIMPAGETMILLSRTMPDINLIGMMLRNRLFTINEEVLRFTEAEIAEYFDQLSLSVKRQDLRDIYDDTQGWAFAVNLIGRSLGKKKAYERYALEAMKTNVFKLIESETAQAVPEPLWRFLLRISLIDHLDASLIRSLAGDEALISGMEGLSAFIRYDCFLDAYVIHHLFLDYLRENQHDLTDEEIRATYRAGAEWCEASEYHTDALSYYEKCGDYDAVTRMVGTFNIQLPQDMALYALEIFERAPEGAFSGNPIYPAVNLKLKVALGQFGEAEALVERYVEEYEAKPESPGRNRALSLIFGAWAQIRLLACSRTHVYDFDRCYGQMAVYFDKDPYPLYGSYATILTSAWASLVGTDRAGAQEEYIEAVSRSVPYASHVLNGYMFGFDNLARGELCFYRREFDDAEQYFRRALSEARSCDQYATQNRALVYLMRMDFTHGNLAAATAKFQELESLPSKKDYGIRYTMYDIAAGFYYLAVSRPEQAPDWLKGEFSDYAHPAFVENYANRVKAQYHYQTRRYRALLSFIEKEYERQTILYGRIELQVFKALSLYQLKQREEAAAALTEAYRLSLSNRIIYPFLQNPKDMRTLTAACLRNGGCDIPVPWLEDINRKASSFAKRQAHIVSQYKLANHLDGEISLTNRETEIMKDLSLGLSRTEIAASRNISTNTVKMTVNIIYEKLCAKNLADAVHIATDLKII